MAMVLPQEINYASIPSIPPNTTSREVVLQPINGSVFSPSSMIEIQFPNGQGDYMDPASLYYRFKITVSNAGTATVAGSDWLRGAAALTTLSRVETYSGSQLLESINEYGMITNDLSAITMDQAQRYGQAYNMGLTTDVVSSGVGVGEFSSDYTYLPVVNSTTPYTIYVAFPVLNCLSQADKLVPLGRMGNIIMRFTTETAANLFRIATGGALLTYTISNFELCYTAVHMSDEVENMLYASGEKFYIKSCGWASSANSISAGTNGQVELSYPLRYSSIKSLFAHFSPSGTTWGKYDSVALQNTAIGNGQARYQFTVNGVPVLSRELDTLYNPAGILCELRKAVGGLSSKTNSMSIAKNEFERFENDTVGISTTRYIPGRHIVAVNCETLPGASGSLLTGISSSSSNITFRTLCNITNLVTVLVYINYDLLLEVDPVMRSVIAKF